MKGLGVRTAGTQMQGIYYMYEQRQFKKQGFGIWVEGVGGSQNRRPLKDPRAYDSMVRIARNDHVGSLGRYKALWRAGFRDIGVEGSVGLSS